MQYFHFISTEWTLIFEQCVQHIHFEQFLSNFFWAFLVAQMIKDLPAMQETPGSGRYPGEGNGEPLQYSCLENPMDWEAWWARVRGVTKRPISATIYLMCLMWLTYLKCRELSQKNLKMFLQEVWTYVTYKEVLWQSSLVIHNISSWLENPPWDFLIIHTMLSLFCVLISYALTLNF